LQYSFSDENLHLQYLENWNHPPPAAVSEAIPPVLEMATLRCETCILPARFEQEDASD